MEPRLDRLHRRLERRRGVRHVIVGAASLDGGWEWMRASGGARPAGLTMTTDTPWFLASVTKLYITAVVMRLVEDGLMDLRTPMRAYLPEDGYERLHVLDGVDHTHDITVEHLLRHASGLPDYLDEKAVGGKALIDEVIEDGDRAWAIADVADRVRTRMTPHFAPSPLDSPKPRIRYSDTNFRLLVAIVEAITASPMERAYRTHLFDPLGLTSTWLPGEADPVDVEPASVWVGDIPLDDRPLALRSFGDLYATVSDVLAFGRAVFTGAVFADPSTAARLWADPHAFGFPRSASAIRSPSWPIQYGLGTMYYELGRVMAGGRRIPALVGHTGATGSWLWYCPDLGLLLAGTVDQALGAALPFRDVPRAVSGL